MIKLDEYIPIYIKQIIAATPKKTITAERWNELWNLVIAQGDYNSEAMLSMASAVLELVHMGEYDPLTPYLRLNTVSYQNSSYMAKQDTDGNLPTNTTYWGMIAEKGDSAYQVWLDLGNVGTEADFLNDLLASKVAELDAHVLVKQTQLDNHTIVKETQLNNHTTGKETQLDNHTVVKEGALNTHTGLKETQLNVHTGLKETQLDIYAETKEVQLDFYTGTKEDQLDDYTLVKEGELDAYTTSLTLDLDDLETRLSVFEAYNPLTAYKPLNKVAFEGNSYVCIADTTGNAPPNATFWLLIAQKGPAGEGIAGDVNDIDGGSASSVFTLQEQFDGGGA